MGTVSKVCQEWTPCDVCYRLANDGGGSGGASEESEMHSPPSLLLLSLAGCCPRHDVRATTLLSRNPHRHPDLPSRPAVFGHRPPRP